MTKLLSIRVKPEILSAIEERSGELGCNRSQYIMELIQRDIGKAKSRRRFSSEDLIGSVSTGIPAGDNKTLRHLINKRLREKNC